MTRHEVRVHLSSATLPREEQLAWKLAGVALDVTAPLDDRAVAMAANRVIDNAAVAVAALARPPVVHARLQALAHPRPGGATVLGLPADRRVHAEWAAWADATAIRELDFHDTFLAADYAHPADSIPALLAVAQQTGASGADLVRGILAAYEVHVALVKGICLHEHKKDHMAHLCPATAAGLGALLRLPHEQLYQAVQQAVHVAFTTRQSRKGEISSWKAYVPAHSGKLAIEAVDRAMRGERSPSPIYEGEDSVIAWMLGGPEARYEVPLPDPGEPRTAILETYTKEHSAEYQAQAMIDLAFDLRERAPDVGDPDRVSEIVIRASHHTHHVIGTGSGDPQKFDPGASRETLDHSLPYIVAVALQDGRWHHVDSYLPERAARPDTVRLWRKIRTEEDPRWTRRYLDPDPSRKAFGGHLEVRLEDGTRIEGELAVAHAHPNGRRPFGRPDYERKFRTLAEGIVEPAEAERFLARAADLRELPAGELAEVHVRAREGAIPGTEPDGRGIF